MMTEQELKTIEDKFASSPNPTPEELKQDMAALVAEITRLRSYIVDYNRRVTGRVDEIEADMNRLLDENARLIQVKEVASLERDFCVGLIARMALAMEMRTGLVRNSDGLRQVVIDLPAGQVSWDFQESEAHLFETLPAYEGTLEDVPVEIKYSRVMNPGI